VVAEISWKNEEDMAKMAAWARRLGSNTLGEVPAIRTALSLAASSGSALDLRSEKS